MGPQPRPYSPEYGAAPIGRCLKIPAKRPSQIETNRFDLKRRNHRAIQSFRSITVLRKRSERRVLRRGSPGASLPSFAALRKKVAPAGAKHPPSKLPSPPQRAILHLSTYSPLVAAIRSLVPSPDFVKKSCNTQPHWIPRFWTRDGGVRGR